MFCILATSCRYLILFAAIIFSPEDEIIYLFRKLESKKKKTILEVFKSPLQNGYSEKLKCLLIKMSCVHDKNEGMSEILKHNILINEKRKPPPATHPKPIVT